MIRQLDVAAAAGASFAAVCATRVTVHIHVHRRTERLCLAIAVAVGGGRSAGHERRVGAVLAQSHGVVDAADAAALVVGVTVVDEDGAATALETLTTRATTTHDDYDDGRQ